MEIDISIEGEDAMSDLIEKYKIVARQEKELRFDHFDNDDAWELGSIIVEEARKKGLAIAVDIVINGYKVFRYGFQGTNNYNDIWLTRKINSVTTIQKSTLRLHYMMAMEIENIYTDGDLKPSEFATMGGGFPIYVSGVGVIGVLAVSGLPHVEDHELVVEGICQFLNKEVERIVD